jgi:protein SCO1/2
MSFDALCARTSTESPRWPLASLASAAGLDLASVATDIDDLRRRPERRNDLAALLDETAPIYAGRSAVDAERLRAYVLASFAEGPSAEQIQPFVLEQIESGHDPFAVAAAAKVLRNMTAVPEGAAVRVVEAIRRLQSRDAYVWHDELTTVLSRPPDRTMLMELAQTLAQVMSVSSAGGRHAALLLKEMLDDDTTAFHPRVRRLLEDALQTADIGASEPRETGAGQAARHCCCGGDEPPPISASSNRHRERAPPFDLAMQDQDGSMLAFGDFFRGHVSVVAFFYTRCENPEKCSLTIANLAKLQRLIHGRPPLQDVRLAAVTYDPAFDTPARLAAYGRDRGIAFDERTKLLRTVGPLSPLAAFFDLGVSFGEATVNMHRVELAVLDRDSRIAASLVRRTWQPEEIVEALAGIAGR